MVESIRVTMNKTSTYGRPSNFSASSQARLSAPASPAFLGGVWGNVRLNTVSANEITAATRKIHRISLAVEFALKRKISGHDTTIQPMVPPMRTIPKSLAGSFRGANATALVNEIVGT